MPAPAVLWRFERWKARSDHDKVCATVPIVRSSKRWAHNDEMGQPVARRAD